MVLKVPVCIGTDIAPVDGTGIAPVEANECTNVDLVPNS